MIKVIAAVLVGWPFAIIAHSFYSAMREHQVPARDVGPQLITFAVAAFGWGYGLYLLMR